jgi:phosphate transport system substrate-binding protein
MSLSLKDLYLALAKEVPDPSGDKKLVPNPYNTWKDVNKTLPNLPIKVMGPSSGSGTRSVFNKLAMGGGCASFDWLRALRKEDMLEFKTVCRTFREDGAYIPAGEDDNQTIKHLATNLDTIAILSFGVMDRNQDKIRGLTVDGIKPDFNTIADHSYPISRPLYLYVKKAHVDVVQGIREFLEEVTSEKAWGTEGYLKDHGLVPMSADERKRYNEIAKKLTPMPADF